MAKIFLNVLLAIIQVEFGSTLEDVMQSSESMGLPPNTLRIEDSIKQGCKYFASLLESANAKGCDLNSVIQSYNYGGGFLDYLAGNGKKYTFPLAENFSKMQSDVVLYLSLYISVKRNIIKLWRCYAWII
ncbi:hypothetical protein EXM36_09025 [Clostridium botulinum]|uniref:CwlT-like lysozyme domain-containing protein n=1 Tax=Clostridium botulinum TaxID=1491 RepID=A0A6B3WJI6_CLOBO|nr:hypothetical protein AGE29_15285 [Clostridium botulinum]MBY6757998.1 lysozyme family protein [Clostridium botulinum]MBY6801376.1 lysozyme family protein [Clostridium botulinum]MBY6881118.1 lysozyme family protein [Clostridium botulinum]MBY6998193.1 lysozyme family protein [Clostridium botulinum]